MTRTKPAKTASPAPPKKPPVEKPPVERPASAFVEQLAADPVGEVLAVLADEAAPLGAAAIKQRLVARGASATDADRAWTRAQEKVRYDNHVIFDQKNKYAWTSTARTISPAEAVYQLARGGNAAQRTQWLGVIQAALEAGASDPVQLSEARTKIAEAERRIGTLELELAKRVPVPVEPPAPTTKPNPKPEPEPEAGAAPDASVHDQYDRAERRRLARERQARIDAMSTVAELAAEVEELTAKQATAEVLLEHTRALTGDRGLEAIGRAGEPSPYDETRHDPVGDVPASGEPVIVIRPGYLWHAPGEAVLISRALVKRR